MEIVPFRIGIIVHHSQLSRSKLKLPHPGVNLIAHKSLATVETFAKMVQESVLVSTF